MSEQPKKEAFRFKRDENGNYLCHLCTYTAKYGSTLHYHLKKQHHNNCEFVCPTCNYPFLHKLALETHIASRHPEANTKVTMFHCDVQGCEFESLTRGNLEIHKARKHYAHIVQKNLETVDVNKKKVHHCKSCQKDFNSGTSFNYHIVRFLDQHQ